MILYDIFFILFSIVYLPALLIKRKAHRDFTQRFGRLPETMRRIAHTQPVWIHAVSVGEVLAVKHFIKGLSQRFPGKRIVLSTTTKTGNAVAQKTLGDDVLLFYFPLDIRFIVRRVIEKIGPTAVIIMETEIWPNLLTELARRAIPVVVLNGRISDRSFKGYNAIRFIFKNVVEKVTLFCMQTTQDAERIEALGAPGERVRVTGNMKFDIPSGRAHRYKKKDLGIDETLDLLVAGSTHAGEEDIVLDAHGRLSKEFDNLMLIIAPRHIARAQTIRGMVEKKGFTALTLSQLKRERVPVSKKTVLIVDTYGDLGDLYELAAIVFMGGSLIKRGGHNLVEPAIFGKPILFGPHMFNFRDMARVFLAHNAAVLVKNGRELFGELERLAGDTGRRALLGRNARELINTQRGATARNITEVGNLLA
jgi:3-deoxy-D-manno-octulosonic-acid transferase